jgi:cytoskeletal protein RodZ
MSADRTPGDFGSRLRDARERRGMSLRHIANATKITVAALDALERNEISRLPGGIFSRAFVRSYAIEVGLDPDQAIQDFVAQFPNDSVAGRLQPRPGDDVANPGNAGAPGNHDADVSTRRVAPAFVALVFTVLGVLYFATAGRHMAAPVVAAVIDFVLKERRAAATSVPSPPPALPPPPVAAMDGSTPADAATVPVAATTATIAASRAPAATATTTLSAVAAAPVPAAAPPQVAADRSEPPTDTASAKLLTVVLFARRPCWISAASDGRKAIDRLLQAGERRTIDVRGELVVTAGDASAIAMTLNGVEARPLGKPGEVVTVRLNPANFREYLPGR